MTVDDQPNTSGTTEPRPTVLVTGGAGFLGRAVVDELSSPRGEPGIRPAEIRVFDRTEPPPHPDRQVTSTVGDIRDLPALTAACDGVDVVIHCAAVVDWGRTPEQEVISCNVDGTRNVVTACQRAGVAGLVHVSTLDVVLGYEPIRGGDEALPIPAEHRSLYCRTKAEAEKIALAAAGSHRRARPGADRDRASLVVTALRPCCIVGEGDPYHLGSLVEMAKKGPVIRIGDGSSRCSHVYVRNMAHALALAAAAVHRQDATVNGQAYFITDFPPQNFFDYAEPVLRGAGYRMLPRWAGLPRRPLYALGALLEKISSALRPHITFTPTVTRFAVDFVCNDFWVTAKKAQRDLGFTPVYTEQEMIDRAIEWFSR